MTATAYYHPKSTTAATEHCYPIATTSSDKHRALTFQETNRQITAASTEPQSIDPTAPQDSPRGSHQSLHSAVSTPTAARPASVTSSAAARTKTLKNLDLSELEHLKDIITEDWYTNKISDLISSESLNDYLLCAMIK